MLGHNSDSSYEEIKLTLIQPQTTTVKAAFFNFIDFNNLGERKPKM